MAIEDTGPRRAVLFAALLMLACLLRPAAASGNTPEQIVFPVGSFPTDVLNVQAAVNTGGTILLKAVDAFGNATAFEFGQTGSVFLTNHARLIGETSDGGTTTTIRGGLQPFRSVAFQPVHTSVRGIHFDGPRSAAVFLHFSSGLDFTGNMVTDVIGTPFGGGTKGQAVWITAGPGRVTGTISIVDNVVERVFADLSYGFALAGFDAEARIARNTVRATPDTGILVVGGTQPVWIEDNVIDPGDAPFPGFFSLGNGIFAGQGAGAFYIRRNTVVCGNPFADGIALSGHVLFPGAAPASSVVEQNDVTMRNSLFGALTIYGQIDPSLVANNRVRGDGAHAIFFTFAAGNEQTSSIVFRGNNITGFRSSVSDVLFDVTTRDSVLAGYPGTVIDLGFNNRITGFRHVGPSIGAAIQEAHRRKRALLALQPGPH